MNGTVRRVLVGYDGSLHAERALVWAAGEAVRRRSRLEVLTIVDDDVIGIRGPVGMAHWWTDVAVEAAQRTARRGVEIAVRTYPELEAVAAGRPGLPAAALAEASRTADLLVLGTRGRNPLAELALGSVAERVATHGYCPIVVVRGPVAVHPGPDHSVVVGVDGSSGAFKALDVAADWAQQAAAPLTLMCAWNLGSLWDHDARTATPSAELEDRALEGARRTTAQAVTHALQRHPGLRVQGLTILGTPTEVLLEGAADAGAVVVGTRGRGAFTSLVLGSVSHALIRTAPCGVAVVGERVPERGAADTVLAMAAPATPGR